MLEANRDAQAAVASAVTEVTAEAFGRESGTTREIARQYAALFAPASSPEPRAGDDRPGVLR